MESLIPPIPSLQVHVQPLADALGLHALPLHIHEILLAALFYHFIFIYLGPWLSKSIFSNQYNSFNFRVSLKWRIQCVSLVQSILISTLALTVIYKDEHRKRMTPEERVWGYDGPAGTVQAFATGYFVWDLFVAAWHLKHLGLPDLIHASSCVVVYLLGFRPVFNYYSCVFILFELSTPFLNIHLFLNQLGKAGSRAQLFNGIILIVVFFFARIVWGFYSSYQWYSDIWQASTRVGSSKFTSPSKPIVTDTSHDMPIKEVHALPYWLIGAFVTSNVALNSLNVIWFGKMVSTVLSRGKNKARKQQ